MELVNTLSKGNKSAFSKCVGISNQSLAEILGKRQSAPSFAALQKIFIAFPQIRMEWLLLGEGEMLQNTDVKPRLSPQELEEAIQHIRANQFLIRKEIGIELQSPTRIAELEGEVKWSIRTIKKYESEIEELTEANSSDIEIIRLKAIKSDHEGFVANCQAALKKEREALRLTRQETDSWSYQIDGQIDIAKPFGGLLSYRLGISLVMAQQLVAANKIRSDEIEGGVHRISERAVREFLGESGFHVILPANSSDDTLPF